MTETTEKLLPCPFCNGEAKVFNHHDFDKNVQVFHNYFVACRQCCAQTDNDGETELSAIAAWNRRVADKPKWTKETPTETGWTKETPKETGLYYLYRHGAIYTALITESCTPEHPGYDKNEVHILDRGSFDYWGTIDEYLDCKWQKITVSALPEKGEETE